MNFLLVLDESERHWEDVLSIGINKLNGTYQVVNSAQEASDYLKSVGNGKVDEVICGTFGGLVEGEWPNVEEVVREAKIEGITLLTGDQNIYESIGEDLKNRGVRFIDKGKFHKDQFAAERGGGSQNVESRS